jgi:hypothetical protein
MGWLGLVVAEHIMRFGKKESKAKEVISHANVPLTKSNEGSLQRVELEVGGLLFKLVTLCAHDNDIGHDFLNKVIRASDDDMGRDSPNNEITCMDFVAHSAVMAPSTEAEHPLSTPPNRMGSLNLKK